LRRKLQEFEKEVCYRYFVNIIYNKIELENFKLECNFMSK